MRLKKYYSSREVAVKLAEAEKRAAMRDETLAFTREELANAILRAEAAEAVAEERRDRAKKAELALEAAEKELAEAERRAANTVARADANEVRCQQLEARVRELEQECVAYRAQLEGRLR